MNMLLGYFTNGASMTLLDYLDQTSFVKRWNLSNFSLIAVDAANGDNSEGAHINEHSASLTNHQPQIKNSKLFSNETPIKASAEVKYSLRNVT